MGEPSKDAAAKRREAKRTVILLLVIFLFVLGGVFGFLRFYDSYIDKTLYAERLSQMREVTTQLFSGLEDAMENQWRSTSEQCATFQASGVTTADDLFAFMTEQYHLGSLAEIQCNLFAVDEQGVYCTKDGWQGLLPEREYLRSAPERISYVSNSMTTNGTRMVFLLHL